MNAALRMYRGDTQTFDVLVTNLDDGTPVDITSSALRFTAKYRASDGDDEAIIIKTSEYGGINLGYGEGEATITIEPEDTEDLTKRTELLWDLQLTDVGGAVKTAAAGRLIIYADISRAAP